jgi:hypothetical protein
MLSSNSYINFYTIEDIYKFLEENKNIKNAFAWRNLLKKNEMQEELKKFSYLRFRVVEFKDNTYTMLRDIMHNYSTITISIDYIPKLGIIDKMLELINQLENGR